jgi:hypothetical protein
MAGTGENNRKKSSSGNIYVEIMIHVEKVNGLRTRNFIMDRVIYMLLMICK